MSNILSNPEEFDDEIESVDCPRCKCCEMYWEECWSCGGEGGTDGEELVMEDPMWYDENDFRQCDICEGKGGWHRCDCDENGEHKHFHECPNCNNRCNCSAQPCCCCDEKGKHK